MNPKLVLVPALALCGSALAVDIHVPGDAPDIQTAIDLAEAGDRVIVAPGVWSGPIDFLGKSIAVEAASGPQDTILDGLGDPGFVVIIETAEASLDGFTVTGGLGTPGSLGTSGGGIRIENAMASLSRLIVEGNRGVLGGGVSAKASDLVITDSTFRGNEALQGAGVYVESGSLALTQSSFEDNEAVNFGGALAVLAAFPAEIEDSEFHGNTASGFGGALYANFSDLRIERSGFVGNGRAQPLSDGVSWVVHTGGGGAIYTTATNGRIESSRLLDNVAAFGTGLYIAGSGEVEVVNSLLAGNGLPCNCGTAALYVNSASPRVINTTIVDNGGFASVFTTYNAFPEIVNSILAGNEVATAGNGLAQLSWSLIDSTAASASVGAGVVQADPLLDADDDYRPLPGSPAIDAGSNVAVPVEVEFDLVGQLRFVDDPNTADTGEGDPPLVDIGAIEFQPADSSVLHDRIFHNTFQTI